MTVTRASYVVLAMIAIVAGLSVGMIAAQTPAVTERRSEFGTRADLEARATLAESQHRTSEAWLLRNRLEKGDFQEGDRIVMMLHTTAVQQPIETVTVRAGKVVQLPRMEDLKLEGVLRSELTARLVQHLAKYLRDPEAQATPLLRVAVLGTVGRPGYFWWPADIPLNDVIMRAGGPGPDADMNGVIIKRGPEVIWSEEATRTALIDGVSLDRLNLRAGDEIFVPVQRHISWLTVFGVVTSVTSIIVTFIRFR
jgi:protein involved in polysaccharide export with SLBB domain